MHNAWAKIIFGSKKRYALPILFLLFFKKELTFDQLYDLCSKYVTRESGERVLAKIPAVRETRVGYKAISRESISKAVKELKSKRYVTKEARLGEKGRSYAVYVLMPETRQLMERYVKK